MGHLGLDEPGRRRIYTRTVSPTYVAPLVATLLVVFVFGYYGIYVPSHLSFVLTPSELQIRGDLFYSRTIPRAELLTDQALIVERPSVQIRLRTNGVSLPSYQSGWFRTNQGKALSYARPGRALLSIPTANNYTLLITPQSPAELLAALRTPGSALTSPLAS